MHPAVHVTNSNVQQIFLGYSSVFQKGYKKNLIRLIASVAVNIVVLISMIFAFASNALVVYSALTLLFGFSVVPASYYISILPKIKKAMRINLQALRSAAGRQLVGRSCVPSIYSTRDHQTHLPIGPNALPDLSYRDFYNHCISNSNLNEERELHYKLVSCQSSAEGIALAISSFMAGFFTTCLFTITSLSLGSLALVLSIGSVAAFIVKDAFVLATTGVYKVMLQNPDLFFRTDYNLNAEERRRAENHLYEDLYVIPLFLPDFWRDKLLYIPHEIP